jgi:hypothetical protein
MKGAAWAYGALAVWACSVAAPAWGGDVTDLDRVYDSFAREAATVGSGRGRFEVRGLYVNEQSADLNLNGFPVDSFEQRRGQKVQDIQGGVFDLLGSYGLGERSELGVILPFFVQDTDVAGASSVTDNGIGDLELYVKFKRQVATNCSVAGGLELTLPTGNEKKTFGTGELGFNPFLSSRYQRGSIGVGGHVGYRMFTGHPDDEFNWGVQFLLRANQQLLFRAEVSGRYFKSFGDEFNDVLLLPGLDFGFGENVVFRPTMLIGLSEESPNWGAGLGLVIML